MEYILYNPLSGNGNGEKRARNLSEYFQTDDCKFIDIREISDYNDFFAQLTEKDNVIVAGGDGTLNRFVNATAGISYSGNIFYHAIGSGNDFHHDVAPDETKPIPINRYINDLPVVTVKRNQYRFINGIGYGIDGYCCEVGDKLHEKSDKPVNYAGIAIKGLLFHYKRANAKVTVDGKHYEFKKVWLAPTMKGRFYGGGMMVAPEQDRLKDDKTVTVVIMHGSGKLKTLMVFPSIFKGEHVKHTEMVTVLTGKEITVEFDRPTALQVDGETVLGVTSYSVSTGKPVGSEKVPEAETV